MPQHSPGAPGLVQVLLVEDSIDDADLMIAALEEGRLPVRVSRVEDGEEAILYLRRQGPYLACACPDLVLLDLHLPRKHGREVLAEIKQDAELKRIPVIIMTSSDDERDVACAYDAHANCYVIKPSNQEQFAQTVRQIERFWHSVALPTRNGRPAAPPSPPSLEG
jgi:two-component system, chemotaxis family, response regulator Rcp1